MPRDLYLTLGRHSISYFFLGCTRITVSSTNGTLLNGAWRKDWIFLKLIGHFLLVSVI
ncbi:hypothetical protein Golob_025195, partial [Gossypium lobatum]|nr:hypothetical protein [Gossypium lobatum]